METLLAIYVIFVFILICVGLYKTVDGVNFFVSKNIFRRKWVIVEDDEGEVWRTPVVTSPISGKMTGWRFPTTKIGSIVLHSDGTGQRSNLWKLRWKAL